MSDEPSHKHVRAEARTAQGSNGFESLPLEHGIGAVGGLIPEKRRAKSGQVSGESSLVVNSDFLGIIADSIGRVVVGRPAASYLGATFRILPP